MAQRKLENWLNSLREYVEDTEAPRTYWYWSGIFTICAALQRKVWIPYGLENIYPNLYLLVVAPPGERKGLPPTIAKKFLEKIQIPVAVDSSSKRALTEELAETAKTESFLWEGKPRSMATLAVISKEMSSLLAVDPKGIIEVLTDLFDSHDVWKYKTSGKGEDFLYNVCVSCFVATTPTWFMNNLPVEAIGGGYTSRHIIISGGERYKLIPWPNAPDEELEKRLISDLLHINSLVGQFRIDPVAEQIFTDWYNKTPARIKAMKDERILGFLNRMHVIVLKVAMALHVSYSDDLIINPDDMGRAMDSVDASIPMASYALGGHGRSKLGPDVERVTRQIRMMGKTTLKQLLIMNRTDLSLTELKEVLATIEAMGKIRQLHDTELQDVKIGWVKEDKKDE